MSNDNIKTGLRRPPAIRMVDQNNEVQNFFVWDSGFPGFIPSDQYTRSFDFALAKIINPFLKLSTPTVTNEYTLNLFSGHGLTGGEILMMYDHISGGDRYYTGNVFSVDGDIITMDTPLSFAFDVTNTTVFHIQFEMNVDGSETTQTFLINNPFETAADITKIIFLIRSTSDMDDSLFGSLPELEKGIVLRKVISSSENVNLWNVKNNGEFGMIGSKKFQEKAPSGEYGMQIDLSYAGMENHGVCLRLNQGESMELLIQDDLTSLTSFRSIIQGHFTR